MNKSRIILNEIKRVWEELIFYRTNNQYYNNTHPDDFSEKKSRISTAEGLECFLIPAVNSKVLREHLLSILNDKKYKQFSEAFASDIDFLINETIVKKGTNAHQEIVDSKGFFGDPYLPEYRIKSITKNSYKEKIEITDSVCFIVSTMLHVKAIFNNDSFKRTKKKVSIDNVDMVIEAGIKKIIDWHIKGEGWGWTRSDKGVLTDIYSTWTVAETFSEIDDHLLRSHEFIQGTGTIKVEEKTLWRCIEEAKDYYINPREENGEPIIDKLMKDQPYTLQESVSNDNHRYILNLYNDLYILDSLILFYGDRKWVSNSPWRTKTGEERESIIEIRNKYEIILKKIIKAFKDHKFNFSSDSQKNIMNLTNSDILKSEEYKFELSGSFLDQSKKEKNDNKKYFFYGDKGFVPMFMRVLILMSRYNLGNEIIIENMLNELYVELALSRHSESPEYKYLWDEEHVSIYSTERSIEALTDLFLYYQDTENEIDNPLINSKPLPSKPKGDTSFPEMLSITANIMKGLQESDAEYKEIDEKSLVREIVSMIQGGVKTPEIQKEEIVLKQNIEFAHVKKYLTSLDVNDLAQEVEKEIEKVKNNLVGMSADEFCISIMIDDYNNKTNLSEVDFKTSIEEIYGVTIDYIIRESEITSYADRLIESISEYKGIKVRDNNNIRESYLDYSGRNIPLFKNNRKNKKYSCEVLTACWYLARLGDSEYAGLERKLTSFSSNKGFFADKIINYLSDSKYGEAERNTKALLMLIKGKEYVDKKIDSNLY